LNPRNSELIYIIFAGLIIFIGMSLVLYATGQSWQADTMLLVGLLAMIFIMANFGIRLLCPNGNKIIFPIAALLCGLGAIAIYRLDSTTASLQLLWIAIGIVAMIFIMLIFPDYTKMRHFKYLTGILGIMLLFLPVFFGVTRGGSKLWLDFGFFKFQPSELAKVLLVIFFAAYLDEKKEVLALKQKIGRLTLPPLKHLGPMIVMWFFSMLVLILEKDLGSALLFFSLFIVMLYLATGKISYILSGLSLFIFGAAFCYFAPKIYPFFASHLGHVRVRIDIWLNPWLDPKGGGYQILQSLFAIANGGIAGVGFGKGHPSFIPAVKTDFIFSSIAEELGLFGAMSLLLSYLLFIYQGLKISLQTNDGFGKLIAAGLSFIFGLQTMLIVGGVTKLVPLTGVTLPFVSYGGSSIVANFIIVGLLLKISARTSQVGVTS